MGEGGKLTEDKYSLSGCSTNSHDTDSCTDARMGLASIRVFVCQFVDGRRQVWFLVRNSNDAPQGSIGFPNPVLSALVLPWSCPTRTRSDKDRAQDMCLFGAAHLDGSESPQQVGDSLPLRISHQERAWF